MQSRKTHVYGYQIFLIENKYINLVEYHKLTILTGE